MSRVSLHIDDQIFSRQRHGGISRYFTELLLHIARTPELGVDLMMHRPWTSNAYLADTRYGRRLPPMPARFQPAISRLNRLQTRHMSPDIVHHTYYHEEYLEWFPNPRLRVVTVYDMIPELFPDAFSGGNPHRAKRAFVDSAGLVVCISETTRDDLISVYGEPIAPLAVIPLGVASTFHPDQPPPEDMPDRYVLFVGSRKGYKDFEVLARAVAASRTLGDVKLIAVGGGSFRRSEQALLDSLGITDRVLHRSLSEEGLAGAYAHAEAFVFPSRYEGFGLPTLEAMASGCPAVLADSPAHREVGGDAASYFSVGDSDALGEQLERVLEDHTLRSTLVDRGTRRAQGFTWERTAAQTVEAYLQNL